LRRFTPLSSLPKPNFSKIPQKLKAEFAKIPHKTDKNQGRKNRRRRAHIGAVDDV
jgi:hypothetical protein